MSNSSSPRTLSADPLSQRLRRRVSPERMADAGSGCDIDIHTLQYWD